MHTRATQCTQKALSWLIGSALVRSLLCITIMATSGIDTCPIQALNAFNGFIKAFEEVGQITEWFGRMVPKTKKSE